MGDSIVDVFCKAAEELFGPLAVLAMSEQIPVGALIPALEKAFIRAVEKEAAEHGQAAPATSALAARVGLTRKRVSQLRQDQSGSLLSAPNRSPLFLILRVLESWRRDPDFQDEQGEPAILPHRGPMSFTELVRGQGAMMRPGAVLKELLRIKAVRINDEGRLEMLNRADLDADRRRQGIRDLGEFGSECLYTLVCRIMNPSAPNHYRRVVGLYIDKEAVPRLTDAAFGNAGVWANGFQEAMSERRVTVKPQAVAQKARQLSGHFIISDRPTTVPPIHHPTQGHRITERVKRGKKRGAE